MVNQKQLDWNPCGYTRTMAWLAMIMGMFLLMVHASHFLMGILSNCSSETFWRLLLDDELLELLEDLRPLPFFFFFTDFLCFALPCLLLLFLVLLRLVVGFPAGQLTKGVSRFYMTLDPACHLATSKSYVPKPPLGRL